VPNRVREDRVSFVDDIVIAVDRVLGFTAGMTRAEFETDIKTQDAVIRNLEVLGEAVKNLPAS